MGKPRVGSGSGFGDPGGGSGGPGGGFGGPGGGFRTGRSSGKPLLLPVLKKPPPGPPEPPPGPPKPVPEPTRGLVTRGLVPTNQCSVSFC